MFSSDVLMMFAEGIRDTLYMTLVSTAFAYLLGLPIAILLVVTRKNGLHPMPALFGIFDFVVNILRSVPFLILMLLVTPLMRLIAGKAYGTAGIVMNAKAVGADFVLAWPDAAIGMMDAEQAVRIMYAEEIAADPDQLALIEEKTGEYSQWQSSAQAAAARGYVDDIIEPDATRKRLIAAFEMLYGKKQVRDEKKHSAI